MTTQMCWGEILTIKNHWHAGRTIDEIAALTQRSRTTVERHLRRACGLSREQLRQIDMQRATVSRTRAASVQAQSPDQIGAKPSSAASATKSKCQ